jgi:DNA modification methylase
MKVKIIQTGEVKEINPEELKFQHRLMCGDATKQGDVEMLLNKEKMTLMVTDPPYGINYDPKWRDNVDGGKLENYPVRSIGVVYNDDRCDWSEAYKLFNGDVAYIYHAGGKSGVVAKSIEESGFLIVSQLIWVKPHFALSRNDYHAQHEPIYYAVKKGKNHNWQGSRKETTTWMIGGMNPFGSTQNPDDERSGHSTQKPLDCMLKPIINSSKKGENIYDPFGGSGTTLIACERANRKCFMMELDENYCSVIIERWERLTGKKAVKL